VPGTNPPDDDDGIEKQGNKKEIRPQARSLGLWQIFFLESQEIGFPLFLSAFLFEFL
jgi:hypothetical protein